MVGDLNVYMLAPSVDAKDKVITEVRDVFRKYNYSQKNTVSIYMGNRYLTGKVFL